MAKVHLAPSSLALRKGETAENTKGIRTRYILFIWSSARTHSCAYLTCNLLLCLTVLYLLTYFYVHTWRKLLDKFSFLCRKQLKIDIISILCINYLSFFCKPVRVCLWVHPKTKLGSWISLRRKLQGPRWFPGLMER